MGERKESVRDGEKNSKVELNMNKQCWQPLIKMEYSFDH